VAIGRDYKSMSQYDAVILGAGPSGLSAAYSLAKQGARVVVVERNPYVGGLMRGVQHGDFSLDLGRKELYSRFPEVHSLWTEMIGEDYRPYPHRVGVLHGGRILEGKNEFKGRLRGMSLSQFGKTATSALWNQLKPGSRRVENLEDYFVLRYGRAYYNYFFYGFHKKFTGYDPKQIPAPSHTNEMPRFALLRNRKVQTRGDSGQAKGQYLWYHPARGTQQIIDAIWRESKLKGVAFLMNTEARLLHIVDGKFQSVLVQSEGVDQTLSAPYVIVSLRIPVILKMLREDAPLEIMEPPHDDIAFWKSTALVYLMAHGEPKFPHNWLEVTDMRLRVGRVVNYGTWNGEMVPKGKTALCLEYFSVEGDGIMNLSKEALLKLAIQEAQQNGLIDASQIFDSLVIQLPAVNASTVFRDWRTKWMTRAATHIRQIGGLLDTNRPGIDRAMMAGIDAAHACMTGTPMSDRSLLPTPGWE